MDLRRNEEILDLTVWLTEGQINQSGAYDLISRHAVEVIHSSQ